MTRHETARAVQKRICSYCGNEPHCETCPLAQFDKALKYVLLDDMDVDEAAHKAKETERTFLFETSKKYDVVHNISGGKR